MSVINTNITAMIGQQNLGKAQNSLQTSMERLSSGLRINSAKDDAAGQAIANRMSSQITGLSTAQRNANDGISVAQTAEGALNQVNDNLQRVRELTVQAQNGTNSQDDLDSIQAEIGQRLNEINRISEETDFNGTKVLAKDQAVSIQVGANDGEAININLEKIDAASLSLSTFNVSGPKGTPTGVDPAAAQKEFGDTTQIATASLTSEPAVADFASKFDLSANPATAVNSIVTDDNGNWFMESTVTAANAADTTKLEEMGYENTGSATAGVFKIYASVDPQAATPNGTDLEFGVSLDSYDTNELTNGSTANPLAALDSALSKVDTLRSDLGAVQNRFESAITNLQTNETNLSAARSRIEDADYATEVGNMTKAQILQQAGTSILAQANQLPQGALSLLG
ncbi:FliC/FljB family flagellin [Pistricoccus aurantiacus]|uniref:Flagellin n=1 Tax=Pistricoccus aurantiacus TaxID=1883414 RepID=A0A5B8SXQ1_9GAMM|nr:FliC/FljB family flagellin [Pistricoccus aurantiacus]QEA40275.1 FliC/FljB family flagellin [Pistricoccus aurantiacus]